jgi:hypothetical protein
MGEAVNVGVTVKVWVAAAGSVGGGSVAVVVEVGLANTPVPHPDNKIEIPIIKAIIFFI